MTILKCKCEYAWVVTEEYIKTYGDYGKTCPSCGEIGVETKPEDIIFYDI